MPKRWRPTEDEIRSALAVKKRARGKGACYPCNQRKVRCDMNKPCDTCVNRRHPEICLYGLRLPAPEIRAEERESTTDTQESAGALEPLDPNQSSAAETPSYEEAAHAALLLAILAVGAQYSDRDTQERRRISRDFAKRSFHALRLANFLLRPLLASLQALLMLGVFLQNDGNADAAWVMTGTTMRLAQSLGLHSDDQGGRHVSDIETEQIERRRVWLAISQQDCVLSLCYDRPSAVAFHLLPKSIGEADGKPLALPEVMGSFPGLDTAF